MESIVMMQLRAACASLLFPEVAVATGHGDICARRVFRAHIERRRIEEAQNAIAMPTARPGLEALP
jgi:hypothetical protein